MAELSTRKIRADEGPAFRAIRIQAISDSPTAFGSTLAETVARPPGYWDDRARQGAAGIENVVFVAEDADRWVGVVGGFLGGHPEMPHVDLISMWVHPAYRGQGVGRSLVNCILAWARERGAGRVILWVTETNESAIALYRRSGFTETGRAQPVPSHPELEERQMLLELGGGTGLR